MRTVPTRIDLIKELPPGTVMAEVGCWRAYLATEIMNNCPNVTKLYCVDSWVKRNDYTDPLSDADHEDNLRQAKRHLRGHLPSGRVQLVRGESLDIAANDRTISPLTAVYVDANHSFEACFADLVAWSKRLAPGGVILGHDYKSDGDAAKWNFGVIPAVAKFCAEFGWELEALTAEDFASYRLEKREAHRASRGAADNNRTDGDQTRAMSIPRRIDQIWLGGPMPADVLAMTKTVYEKNPGWLHTLWRDEMLSELGVNADRLKDEFRTWAAASNFVRLLILQKHGGIYLDMDVECLKPLDELLEYSAFASEQDGGRICNAVMGATPNHPWINWQLAHIGDYDRCDAASGVYLATAAPRDLVTIIPRHRVYPWLWDDPPENRMPHADSLLVHHWAGSWTK